jgi:hypothetical protein
MLLCVALVGCGGGGAALVGAPAQAGVTLRVPVDVGLFMAGASLRVHVWNGEQLATIERNGRCSAVFDPATGAQSTRCPEGTSYETVTPEGFEFQVGEIAGSVEVKSTTVRVGERFRILLTAKSRDGCNTVSADHVGTAEAASVSVGSLAWETTAMGCAGGAD